MTEARGPRTIVSDAQLAMAQGDGPGFAALLSDDVLFVVQGTTPISGHYRGKAAVTAWFAAVGARIATATVEPITTLTDGPWVITRDRVTATTVSGRLYANDYLRMWRCDGEAVVEIVEFLDTEAVTTTLLVD